MAGKNCCECVVDSIISGQDPSCSSARGRLQTQPRCGTDGHRRVRGQGRPLFSQPFRRFSPRPYSCERSTPGGKNKSRGRGGGEVGGGSLTHLTSAGRRVGVEAADQCRTVLSAPTSLCLCVSANRWAGPGVRSEKTT